MTPEEFVKKLQNKALEVERYATLEFPNMAGNITLRFINGNFRAQGFQGSEPLQQNQNRYGKIYSKR